MSASDDLFLTTSDAHKIGSEYLNLRENIYLEIENLKLKLPYLVSTRYPNVKKYSENDIKNRRTLILRREKETQRLQKFLTHLKEQRSKASINDEEIINAFIKRCKRYLHRLEQIAENELCAEHITIKVDSVGDFELNTHCYAANTGFIHSESDIRIINPNRRLARGNCAISVDQAEYHQLQELGATLHHDQALSAKLINHLGGYRFAIRKRHFQFGIKTSQSEAKDQTCQYAFSRLRALAVIEACYGKNIDDLKSAVENYLDIIQELHNNQHQELVRLQMLSTKLRESKASNKKQLEKLHWQILIATENLKSLATDHNDATKLLQNLNANSRKIYGLDLLKDKYQTEASKHLVGDDRSKYIISNWVTDKAYGIGRGTKRINEMLTLSGKKTFGRGLLQSHITDYMYECQTYEWPINCEIDPIHQGNFDIAKTGIKKTISIRMLGSGVRKTRDLLFAFCQIKIPLDMNDNDHQISSVISRGWKLLFWRERKLKKQTLQNLKANKLTDRDKLLDLYYSCKEAFSEASESWYKSFSKDFVETTRGLIYRGKITITSAAISIKSTAGKFKDNFIEDLIHKKTSQKQDATSKKLDTFAKKNQAKIQLLSENFEKIIQEIHEKIDDYKAHFPDQEVDVRNKHFSTYLLSIKKESGNDYLKNPYPFIAFNPRTPLSVIDDFAHEFSQFFVKHYDSSPLTWAIASVVYIASGMATQYAQAMQSTLIKMGLPENVAKGIVDYNSFIANSLTKDKTAQFTAAGFTNMNLFYLIMDTLNNGSESYAIKALANLRHGHEAAVMLTIIFTSFLIGFSIRESGVVPLLSDALRAEQGDMPFLNDVFAGLKSVGFVYESIHKNPNEQSALANTASTLLNICFNITRAMLTSPVNLFRAGYYAIRSDSANAKTSAYYFALPWKNLLDTSIRILAALLDFTLRITNLAATAVKTVLKAVFDLSFNFIVNLLPETAGRKIISVKSFIAKKWDGFFRPLVNVSRYFRMTYAKLRMREEFHIGEYEPPIASDSTKNIFKALVESAQAPCKEVLSENSSNEHNTNATKRHSKFFSSVVLQDVLTETSENDATFSQTFRM